jgi:hypothetical protein
MTTCGWVLRDSTLCKKVAQVDGLCPEHFEMRRALEAEERERAARGEPPLSERGRDRFLRRFSRERRAAGRRAARERSSTA